jgi:hypothetical protein
MLVYRGFAVQDESPTYYPGAAVGVGPAGLGGTRMLRLVAHPHMDVLSAKVNETVNLMVRVGTKVRFLSTVEGTNALRVGDRQGRRYCTLGAQRGSPAQLDVSRLWSGPAWLAAGVANKKSRLFDRLVRDDQPYSTVVLHI